ncbi:MAG: ABC transporter permease [Solirubrobacteraceae bacterium]
MIRALLAKDLRVLRRSPALLALVVVYPVLIAIGLGLTLTRDPAPPKVAVVNLLSTGGSGTVDVGGQKISIGDLTRSLSDGDVQAIDVPSRAKAKAMIEAGTIDGALVIPADAADRLKAQLTSGGLEGGPKLEVLYRSSGPLDGTLVRALLASRLQLAQRALSNEIVRVASGFLQVLQDGGTLDVLGFKVQVLGLKAAEIIAESAAKTAPKDQRNGLVQAAKFAKLARENLDLSDNILNSIATPLDVSETAVGEPKDRTISGFAVGVAAALSLMLVAMTLAAGLLASEREEGTMRRLLRGGQGAFRVVTAKTLAAGVVATVSGLVLLVGVAIFGATPSSSAPWWLPATILGALGFSAFGVLLGAALRDARAAALAAILLAVPVAVLALVPSQAVGESGHHILDAISAILPFAPARSLLDAAVATQPDWAATGQLVAQLVVYTLLAGVLVRRSRA